MAAMNKRLGLFAVFCMTSGAMISSGIFVLPGLAHAQAGPAMIFSYFLAGCLAAIGSISLTEVITAMPKAGGDYFFITRTMGPATGMVTGLLSWLSLSLKSALAIVGMGAVFQFWFGWDPLLVSLPLWAIFVGLNLFWAEQEDLMQMVLLSLILALMLLFVIKGAPKIEWSNFDPFAPHGLGQVLGTAGLVFVSYGGLLKVAAVAEEIKEPHKNIPWAIFLSLVVVGFFYVSLAFITSGVLGAEILDTSLSPITQAARRIAGSTGAVVMGLVAVAAFASTASAGIMAASRYLLALSRDGLAPAFLGTINPRHGIPQMGVLATGLFVLATLFLSLESLVKAASSILIFTYLMSNLCVIVLRESRLLSYRPSFKSPGYPWLQIAGSLGFIILIIEMGWKALLSSLLLVLAGLAFYWFYGRIRAQRETALLYLVKRMTDTEASGKVLEKELREIIRERDEMCWDEFDHAVRGSKVLEFKKISDTNQILASISLEAGTEFGIEAQELALALKKRQKSQSTEMFPGVAITDALLPGEGRLELVLVRLAPPVSLSPAQSPTRALFVILFTHDRRDAYLRSLAAIAQAAGNESFSRKWDQPKDPERLREILLTAPRQRTCTL